MSAKALFWSAIALPLLSCGGGGSASPSGQGSDTFLAFPSSFARFRTWPSFHSDGPAAGTQPADVLGPRTQYIDTIPAHGSTSFPVGTMIVEVRESGAQKIFAGVKRGGGYNATGAIDWEWLELQEAADGTVTIVWRGVGPPSGDTYGGDANGSCNSCHGAFVANDYVASPYLQLSKF